MAINRRIWVRAVVLACAIGLADLVLPRLLETSHQPPPGSVASAPAAPGEVKGEALCFTQAPVSDVLEGIAARSGFRAVAFPDTGAKAFTGCLALRNDGSEMVRELGKTQGLSLTRKGPHWVLLQP